MAKKVYRHTLTKKEQALWDREDMKGWRKALEGCIEDEGRDEGAKKYMLYDVEGAIIGKGEVSVLPDPRSDEGREPVAF